MTTYRKIIMVSGVTVVGLYFPLTWFFFGSSHPCGIYEARWKPYAIEIATKLQWDTIRQWNSLGRSQSIEIPEELFSKFVQGRATPEERERLLSMQQHNTLMAEWNSDHTKESVRLHQELASIPEEEARRVHQRAWSLTPAECLWHAITWRRLPIETSTLRTTEKQPPSDP